MLSGKEICKTEGSLISESFFFFYFGPNQTKAGKLMGDDIETGRRACFDFRLRAA